MCVLLVAEKLDKTAPEFPFWIEQIFSVVWWKMTPVCQNYFAGRLKAKPFFFLS